MAWGEVGRGHNEISCAFILKQSGQMMLIFEKSDMENQDGSDLIDIYFQGGSLGHMHHFSVRYKKYILQDY